MKTLYKLLKDVKIIKRINDYNYTVHRLEIDSRKITNNDVFFAIRGSTTDGHHFIESAIEKGAKVIICKNLPQVLHQKITYLQVEEVSYTLGIIVRNFYDNPSTHFKVIVITGTNGKTSCVTLLYELFCELGFICGLISTSENRIADEITPSNSTTPDILSLNELFVKAQNKNCEYIFMEASSHGIYQNRLAGISIDIAGFTNLTHDHLDYHKTFHEYLKAKKLLFDRLDETSIAISNSDNKNGRIILQNCKATKKFYALKKLADYKGKILESRIDGLMLQFNKLTFWTQLAGDFNAYNMLLVFAIACEFGIDPFKVVTQLSKIKKVKGRFETFISKTKITTIIDYAHTPDALKNILKSINQVRSKNETLFTVLGCGGNRDKKKRPKMGNIATQFSDKTIITSDNPRNEDPKQIIEEITLGINIKNFEKYIVIPDRKEAIKKAVLMAKSGDIILISGKGHEDYQEIGSHKYPFNDFQISEKLFIKLKK